MQTAEPRRWLPESFAHPRWLIWLMLVPQALLLAINVNRWQLVHGDMSGNQVALAVTTGAAELLLFACIAALCTFLWRRHRSVRLGPCALLLLAHVAYLWWIISSIGNILPASVTAWLLPETELLYYQFALIMPAVFYAGFRLACAPIPVRTGTDISFTLATLIATPVMCFFMVTTFSSLRIFDDAWIVLVVFLVGATTLLMLAFLRALGALYSVLQQLRRGQTLLLLAAGLIAPLGGLLLNRTIPFPYDFQDPWIYTFTILNGMLLMLPLRTERPTAVPLWLLKCAGYIFSLYFFVVFLPFLPLALLAMLAAGAGFLILAPTLLFIVHTRQLLDAGRLFASRFGTARTTALAIAALLSIPTAYTLRAMLDRQALTQSIDAVYTPDYSRGDVPVNRLFARHALAGLQRAKNGIFVPFLTDYYQALVFDGMILPDHKMDTIALTLFGETLPPPQGQNDNMMSELFGSSRRRRPGTRRQPPPPARSVVIDEVTTSRSSVDGSVSVDVAITLRNTTGNDGAEFVAPIRVPAGVSVTGYWLNVNGTNVPGRLTEKKAAQWVYHMIRDTVRRDPGLLLYRDDGALELRVFPFASGERRQTGLTFTFPDGFAPTIAIGDRTVTLTDARPPASAELVSIPAGPDAHWLAIPASVSANLPTIVRPHYLHFILDRSQTADESFSNLLACAQAEATRHPDAQGFRMTLANYAFEHLDTEPRPLAELTQWTALPGGNHIPFQGALCPASVIKNVLLYPAAPPSPTAPPPAPLFIVVRDHRSVLMPMNDMGPFEHLLPDLPVIGEVQPDTLIKWKQLFSENAPLPSPRKPAPVHAFHAGNTWAYCLAADDDVVMLPAQTDRLTILDADGTLHPVAAPATLSTNSLCAGSAAVWNAYLDCVFRPLEFESRRRDVVAESQHRGVLTPLTSYIVVETASQWEALRRAEQKSLKSNSALAFDEFIESPEPTLWLLLPAAWLLTRRRAWPRRIAFHTKTARSLPDVRD